MPLPTCKAELLKNLKQAYVKLDAEFNTVSSEHERLKMIEGNVSCCDVVAYQIGWTNLLMGWDRQEERGESPSMPAEGFRWNQLGELAQSFYERNSEKKLGQLRREFHETFQALARWIESLTEQEIFQPHQRQWTGDKWAMVKWIQVNTIAPYGSARTKVRRWKREMGLR